MLAAYGLITTVCPGLIDIVQCFLCGLQGSDVGGEDVDHALQRMDLDGTTALAFEALTVAKRVVEENFVFTQVNSYRR
jgi:hypothetical protein